LRPSSAPSPSVLFTTPAPTNGDKKKKKKHHCFSAWNTVKVQGKGVIAMESLQVGDMVQVSNDGHYSPVLSFVHEDHEAQVEYLQIYMEQSDVLQGTLPLQRQYA
jgi:hypothetical protein